MNRHTGKSFVAGTDSSLHCIAVEVCPVLDLAKAYG